MLAEMDTGIDSAYKRLQVISQDDAKRREYDARMKAIRDYNQGMIEAEERGERRGIVKGLEKGREEGREEGKEEGRGEIIKSLLESMPLEEVSKVLKMPVAEVRKAAGIPEN